MSDERPQGNYGWLYGNDEPTRPAPRADAAPPPPPNDLPPPNLPPPGRRPAGPTPPGRPRKRFGKGRIVLLVVLAWVVFLVAVPIWAWGQIAKVDASPASGRPDEQPGTTYLLVGSDSRRGLTKEEQKELSTGGDSGGRGRTDTIMMLHTGDGPSILMSIPRDSIVDIPGYGRTKINAAYTYGGAKLLVRTIEGNTGIHVDNYVEVGFGGLVKVVDSLGGVEICPKDDIKDKDSGLDVKEGCQTADGATALAYSRNRHSYATQDIQRVQSQREVLGSIAAEAKSPWTVLNPFRYVSVAKGASGSLTIGDDVGPIALGRFALALSAAMGGDGLSCTVPLQDLAVNWDATRAPQMFEYIQKDQTAKIGSLCTKDGLPKG
ncbi:LCP family protein [Aeromicrobium stalagmiti]|uniref:LCP family protein n=1 Tax=Aeromicrobium stalagmiti TaxID=2738988 RepID=UPI0015680E19|nr:LCP family protein [Aeromicrobium stalagmiti]NRQ51497.1 LCP family protein [Aeromicrobium stalagmiti]